MSTEEEQHNLYTKRAQDNAYEILCKRFCEIDKAFEFQEMSLEDKKQELKKIVEEII